MYISRAINENISRLERCSAVLAFQCNLVLVFQLVILFSCISEVKVTSFSIVHEVCAIPL